MGSDRLLFRQNSLAGAASRGREDFPNGIGAGLPIGPAAVVNAAHGNQQSNSPSMLAGILRKFCNRKEVRLVLGKHRQYTCGDLATEKNLNQALACLLTPNNRCF
jgi:hypothetical protein